MRTWLALCLHRAIERARVEVAAADQRKHMAGARIDRHERRLEVVCLVELRQPCAISPLRRDAGCVMSIVV